MKPTAIEISRPMPTRTGVTLNANATWVKLAPMVETDMLLNSR